MFKFFGGGNKSAKPGKRVELDVREQLRNKQEPFQLIMDTVKTVGKEDVFILHATFKPTPLLGLMKVKGFTSEVEQLEKDHWVVTFRHKSNKAEGDEAAAQTSVPATGTVYELDNRGLEPPNPMIRTLSKLEKAQPGDIVRIHNDRVPMFLIEELNQLGYPYEVEEQEDGSAKVSIHKR